MLLAPNIGNEKNVLLKSFLKSGACLEPSWTSAMELQAINYIRKKAPMYI